MLRALAALTLPGSLAACGGGGSSQPAPAPAGPQITGFAGDKTEYGIGDKPVVTATFSGGAGRIEPGAIAVASGAAVTLPALTGNATFKLVVSGGGQEITRELALKAAYRGSFKPVPMAFARGGHEAVCLASGRVLIIGGQGSGGVNYEVMAFDPATETFSAAGGLLTGRSAHTATVLKDGTVLVVGGDRTVMNSPSAERYDPATGASRATAGQPLVNRSYHSATLLDDGRVLLAGGLTAGANSASDTADLYDPATDSFTRLLFPLQVTRLRHTAMQVSPRLLVLYGGMTVDGKLALPEVLDIEAQSSSLMNSPLETVPRSGANLVKRAGADYVVIGGENGRTAEPLANIVNVGIGGVSVQAGGTLRTARSLHASATLADGRVLVAGGVGYVGGAPLASTEIYSAQQAATVAGPALQIARQMHTATALPNGKVLIVGGFGPDRQALATAELYS